MELYDAMSTLRAVRRLKPDPIPAEVQERILTAATWAPTGGNVQPWRIIAVTDADKKEQMEALYKPLWEQYIVGYRQRMEKMDEAGRKGSERTIGAGDYLASHMLSLIHI